MWSKRVPAGAEIADPSHQHSHWFLVAASAAAALCTGARPAHAAEPIYETVVVAEAGERARQDDAASSSVITANRTPRSAEDLPQLLSELPGLSVTRLGGLGSFATLSLRGSSANQVAVYFDGVPLSAASGGGVDIGLIPAVDLESVEVYRGMSPIGFGSSAIGGIVSLASAAATTSGVRAYAGGGSFETGFAGVQARWAGSKLRALASVNGFGSAGDFPYRNDNATPFATSDDSITRRQNNALRQIDGLGHVVGLLPGQRQIWGTASFLHRDQGVPPVGSVLAKGASLGTDRLIATLAYESHDDLGLGSSLRAQLYTVATWQRLDDPCGDVSGGVPTQTRDLSSSSGATLAGAKPITGWLKLSAVAEGRYERFDPTSILSGAASIPPGSRAFGAGGVEARLLVQALRLAVIPSLRLEAAKDTLTRPERYRLMGADTADTQPATYWLPNARLALVQWASEQVTLRANLGRYGRLPSMIERYGNTGQLLGNPNLVPERGTNADVGANWTRKGERLRLSLDGALFAVWASNLILFRQGRGYTRPGNLGRARILGVETSVTVDWRGRFRFFGQTTFTDARDLEDVKASYGRQLPHRPRLRAYARPELRNLALAGRWRWGLYADLDATSGNYLDSSNLVEVNPRVLFGAGGQVSAPHWGLRLVASAHNLANTPVVDFAGYPVPGRSVFLTLQWSTPDPIKETLE
jgi:iron complex outermembrane receptor protein